MNQEELDFFEKEGLTYHDTIANGTFGVIFYVYSKKYNEFFALKKIPVKIFRESEVKCLMEIDDPRVIRLYKYYKFNGSVYLLMEFCKSDLERYIREHRVSSMEDVRRILYDCISAMKVCHDNDVAHCDIKPANFMIDNYGRIKICDFGLSLIGHHECCNCRGTPLFIAPEILSKNNYDPIKADIWAIGVLAYYLTTRKFPFAGKDKKELALNIQCGLYDESEISDYRLKKLINCCLERNPERRVSAKELLTFPFFAQSLSAPRIYKNNSIILKPKIQIRRSSVGDHFFNLSKGKFVRISNDSILL